VHRSRSQFARCKVKLTMRAPGIIRAGPARLFAVIVPAMLIPTLLGARLYRRFTDTGFRRIVLGLLSASEAILVATSVSALF